MYIVGASISIIDIAFRPRSLLEHPTIINLDHFTTDITSYILSYPNLISLLLHPLSFLMPNLLSNPIRKDKFTLRGHNLDSKRNKIRLLEYIDIKREYSKL